MITNHIQIDRTVLYMKIYYLTEEGVDYLGRKKVQYISSINRGEFGMIVNTLDWKLDNSGTHVTV